MTGIRLWTLMFGLALVAGGLALSHDGRRGIQTVAAIGETCDPGRPHASGTSVEMISTSSGVRSYRLHVPPSYTGATPMPLVLNLHGATMTATQQEGYTQFSAKADASGFIVVYPQGLTTAAINLTHFNSPQLPPPEPDDVAFINTLLDSLGNQLCLDETRVFSTGLSNGALMSVRLACSLSSRIAAIGLVAASAYPPTTVENPADLCPDTRPMPVIAFHGTADTIVPFAGGFGGIPGAMATFRLPIDDNTPADDVMSAWAAHNTCTGARMETQIDTEIRLIEYGSCADNAIVRLYAVDGGGHSWPDAIDVASLGYTTHQIDATDLIWAFFTAYTLPDADADLVPDTTDNCVAAANFSQTNNDRNFLDHSPPFLSGVDDKTIAHSDTKGDACDFSDDNDGLSDVDEASGAACGGAVTDPLVRDTDGDRALDGPECMLGTDPTSAASKPPISACGPAGDADGDKLSDRIEYCYYGTNPAVIDTDGDRFVDGAKDGCEAASFNGDRGVNVADMGMLASAISNPAFRVASVDVNKDGVWNAADSGTVASLSGGAVCPLTGG